MHTHLLCLVLVLTGSCRYSASFVVVDATTRAPLSGVQTTYTAMAVVMFSDQRNATRELPPTQDDGIVAIAELKADMAHHLVFRKAGFHPATVMIGQGRGPLRLDPKVSLLSPAVAAAEGTELILPFEFPIHVEMHKE